MKRFFVIFGVVALLVGVLSLTACGGGEQDPALVGTWDFAIAPGIWTYTFDADGRGSYTMFTLEGEISGTFRWSTDGDRLNINRDNAPSGEIRNERWSYHFHGDTLHITSQQVAGLDASFNRQ